MPGPDNEIIAERLESLVLSSVHEQLAYYRSLGMRDRILSLSLMVAAVLTTLWRSGAIRVRVDPHVRMKESALGTAGGGIAASLVEAVPSVPV